jgi:hypothetical protein
LDEAPLKSHIGSDTKSEPPNHMGSIGAEPLSDTRAHTAFCDFYFHHHSMAA